MGVVRSPNEARDLCRDVSLPGLYDVSLGDGSTARFVDNAFGGLVDDDGQPDAAIVRVPHTNGWAIADGWPPVPPWSDLAPDLYRDVDEVPVETVEVLGITVASPFGDVRLHSCYDRGRPVRRLVDEREAADIASHCHVVIRRRLSCVLLYRARVVDLLGSLRGGEVSGDWTRLMLLAGLAEAPSVIAATESMSQRDQLIALALFAEGWAHQVHHAIA